MLALFGLPAVYSGFQQKELFLIIRDNSWNYSKQQTADFEKNQSVITYRNQVQTRLNIRCLPDSHPLAYTSII